MSKTFTCCELIQRIKDWQAKSKWSEKEKHIGIEFIHKTSWKLVNTEARWDEESKENVYKDNWNYLFCEECEKWFWEQQKEQDKLIDAEIEKEKAEGTFYSNPATQKTLREFKEKAEKLQKDLEANQPKNNPPPFEKSPPE